jgi:peptidoglycan-associated lipoprotein
MNHSTLFTAFLLGVLSVFMAACSSTPSDSKRSGAGSGSAQISNSGVATGSVDGSGVSGSAIDASGEVDTVFYFDFDKAILKPESLAALRIHAQRLVANPVNVRLDGHADERGTREYNIALGERRAAAAKEFLVLQGVNGEQIEVISYGEERPADTRSNEAAWALNRRVEIK